MLAITNEVQPIELAVAARLRETDHKVISNQLPTQVESTVPEPGVAADRNFGMAGMGVISFTLLNTDVVDLGTITNGQIDNRVCEVFRVTAGRVIFDDARLAVRIRPDVNANLGHTRFRGSMIND
jgi:hypothetical protein